MAVALVMIGVLLLEPLIKWAINSILAIGNSLAGITVGPYSQISGTLPAGVQANHLNQNAAYKGTIPSGDGVAVGMRGNAFTDVGTPHYDFHQSLEQFWDQYRPGGALNGQRPTNAQYGQALQNALEAGGFNQEQAADLAAQAARQRTAFGLNENDPVPRIPNKMYQAGDD